MVWRKRLEKQDPETTELALRPLKRCNIGRVYMAISFSSNGRKSGKGARLQPEELKLNFRKHIP